MECGGPASATPPEAGDRLFDAILGSPSGVVFTDDDWDVTWQRITTSDGLVHLALPELLAELAAMADEVPPGDDPGWPFLLSAGERRSFTANTIFRDPARRKRDAEGALRVAPADAAPLGLVDGEAACLATQRGQAVVTIAVDYVMQPGHLARQRPRAGPRRGERALSGTGVAPNELTAGADRDPWAGTPWHKSVPARLAPIGHRAPSAPSGSRPQQPALDSKFADPSSNPMAVRVSSSWGAAGFSAQWVPYALEHEREWRRVRPLQRRTDAMGPYGAAGVVFVTNAWGATSARS